MIATLKDTSLPSDEKRAIAEFVESKLSGRSNWLGFETLSPDASNGVPET